MNRYLLAAVVFTMSTVPAFAHHPLGGMPMETLTDGLLSGVGHLLLGFDHLFFVIAVGILALYTSRAQLAAAAYIGAMLLGCLLMSFGVGLPVKELVIGIFASRCRRYPFVRSCHGSCSGCWTFRGFWPFPRISLWRRDRGSGSRGRRCRSGRLLGRAWPAAIRLGTPGRTCCSQYTEGDRGQTYSCPLRRRCCCRCRHVSHA